MKTNENKNKKLDIFSLSAHFAVVCTTNWRHLYVPNNVSDFIRRNDKVNREIETLLRQNQQNNVTTNCEIEWRNSGMGKCEAVEILDGLGIDAVGRTIAN